MKKVLTHLNGPVYAVCGVYGVFDEVYRRCSKCGYEDKSNPLRSDLIGVNHSSCGFH